MEFAAELAAAQEISELAGRLALKYQAEGVVPEDKPDDSPVTIADKESEKLIAGFLAERFPEDGLLGEEGAAKESTNGRRWIIDPIDGTRDFMRGNRLFSNLIALEQDGQPVVGIANFPALGEMYWGVKGGGAYCNGQRLRISSIDRIDRSVGLFQQWNKVRGRPHPEKVLELAEKFWATRSLGGAWDAMFVCSGKAEFWLEPSAKPWDMASIKVIGEESGAVFFDYTGKNTIYGGNAILCVPALEAEARRYLGI